MSGGAGGISVSLERWSLYFGVIHPYLSVFVYFVLVSLHVFVSLCVLVFAKVGQVVLLSLLRNALSNIVSLFSKAFIKQIYLYLFLQTNKRYLITIRENIQIKTYYTYT